MGILCGKGVEARHTTKTKLRPSKAKQVTERSHFFEEEKKAANKWAVILKNRTPALVGLKGGKKQNAQVPEKNGKRKKRKLKDPAKR